MRFIVPVMVGKVARRHLVGATSGTPGNGTDKSLVITTGAIASKPSPGWSVVAYFGAGLKGRKYPPLTVCSPAYFEGFGLPSYPMHPIPHPIVDRTMTRNLALDLSPIRVNAVEPSIVSTGLLGPVFRERRGPPAAVEEVVEAYMYLLRDSNATGEIVQTRGGQHLV
ncbi:hypothetical protein NUW58_g7910 [Xylaria curta]|uniref:Uncharacterized protein n=1 Tax=Xylaria curta TaxID=42375 RepID=A0ACC1NCR8_9PEZI|nr:hypothetical protein NUW58_g7910 [Xylaria curta]